MRKWVLLAFITATLLVFGYFFAADFDLGDEYYLIVSFFAIQTIILFRMDQWAPEEWKIQISMVKIVVRLLSSLVFITVLLYTQENLFRVVIQFILIYLIFMIFEIVEALTNLRRN